MTITIDGYDPTPINHLPPMQPYSSIDDLPLPLRAQLIALARKGLPNQQIADFFELPVQWVQLFTECPPGSPEH